MLIDSCRMKMGKSVPNLPHGIYFHVHVVWKLTVLSRRTKREKKCPKFAARHLFSRACSMEIVSFESAYEKGKKCPKFAARHLFSRASSMKIDSLESAHEKGKKVSQICRTAFISTRMYNLDDEENFCGSFY